MWCVINKVLINRDLIQTFFLLFLHEFVLKTARYKKGGGIHLLNIFYYLNSLAIKLYFSPPFLPPGHIVHFTKNMVILYTIILINKNCYYSRSFSNTRSVSKSKKLKVDLPNSIIFADLLFTHLCVFTVFPFLCFDNFAFWLF